MIYNIQFSPNSSGQIATCDGVVTEATWSMKWAATSKAGVPSTMDEPDLQRQA